jgi:cytochrome P450
MPEAFKTAPRTQQEIELTGIARETLPVASVSIRENDLGFTLMVGAQFTNTIGLHKDHLPEQFEVATRIAADELKEFIRKAIQEPRNTERQHWSQDHFVPSQGHFSIDSILVQTRDDGTSVIDTEILQNLLHATHHERF